MKLSQIYISGDVSIYLDWKTPKVNPTYNLQSHAVVMFTL